MLLHLYLWSNLCYGIFFSYLGYFQSLRQVRGVLNRCSHCSGCYLPFLVFIRYQDINSWAATGAHWECYLWFLYGHNTISSRRSYCWHQDDCRGASTHLLIPLLTHLLTHLHTHSLTHSSTHSLTLTHLLFHSLLTGEMVMVNSNVIDNVMRISPVPRVWLHHQGDDGDVTGSLVVLQRDR